MSRFTLEYIWDSIRKLFGFKRNETITTKEYSVIDTVNFAAIFANSLKNLAITDSTIEVKGVSDRALLLNKALGRLNRQLGKISSFMLGFGGVVVVPYVSENEIYFNIANQDNLIIERMQGDKITDCAILADRIVEDTTNTVYYRFVRYLLENNTLTIQQIVKKDTQTVPLDTVKEWANMQEIIVIHGVKKMPFAYFKNPKDNRLDVALKGVPITYGSEIIIEEIKACLKQAEDEFKYKEARIFIDENLIDKNGKISKEYKLVQSSAGGMFEIFSPEFRDSSYYNRITQLFTLLEKSVGTSSGILTPVQTRGATATEIKASLQDTFSIISEIRTELESGINDYTQACDMLADYYNLSRMGDYELNFDWSYAMIESSQESFAQLLQAQAVGAIKLSEVRQFIRPKESIEDAQDIIDEIKASEPNLSQTIGLESQL